MSTLSSAAVASNRSNARKSTGPRTPRGKAIAAANALRHGMFAKDLLLPGESADELLELKTAMIRRLNPRDPLELELVERVVAACWKIRRLQRFERLLYQQQCDEFAHEGYEPREAHGLGHREAIPAEVAWQAGGEAFQRQLDRYENHQHRLENALHRGLRQLDKLRKQEVDASPSWFAEEALAAEGRQHEKWRNEAADADDLTRAAQLTDANAARERSRVEREEEAAVADGLDDDESSLSPWKQSRQRPCPRENGRNEAGGANTGQGEKQAASEIWRNEAGDAERKEPAPVFDPPLAHTTTDAVVESFESAAVPAESLS